VLGWEQKVGLEEGLAKTYKWIEQQCSQKPPSKQQMMAKMR